MSGIDVCEIRGCVQKAVDEMPAEYWSAFAGVTSKAWAKVCDYSTEAGSVTLRLCWKPVDDTKTVYSVAQVLSRCPFARMSPQQASESVGREMHRLRDKFMSWAASRDTALRAA